MERYDAVIVGAGAAGLSVATAAPRHARILLLDRDDGSSSDFAKSGGGLAAAGTTVQKAAGIEDSPAIWTTDIRKKTDGTVEVSIVELVTSRARDVAHFQADQLGIDIHLAGNIPVAGHSVPRLHVTPSEIGREYAQLLAAAAARLPNIVRINDAEVTGLLVDKKSAYGVRARIRGQEQRFQAPFTVLACGGFAANRTMLRSTFPRSPRRCMSAAPTMEATALPGAGSSGPPRRSTVTKATVMSRRMASDALVWA